jgi:hypothetical protein
MCFAAEISASWQHWRRGGYRKPLPLALEHDYTNLISVIMVINIPAR